MKVACLMMQKNEGKLLRAWLKYYSSMFNISDIFVYDNGSTDEYTLSVLEEFELSGLNVFREYSSKKDFESKGYLLSSKIKDLELLGVYDFFFPLDCDEFIACELDDGSVSLSKSEIFKSLSQFKESEDVLYIKKEYNNHPARRDYYMSRVAQRKCFFAADSCDHLDMGYHDGRAKRSSSRTKTSIVYFHFHNKPYDMYQISAREKLAGRVADFSVSTLEKHLSDRKSGFHLIPYLFMSQEEYVSSFDYGKYSYVPQLRMLAADGDQDSFFESIPADRCDGCVDHISEKDDFIRVIGWAVDGGRQSWSSIHAEHNGVNVGEISCVRKGRPDVVSAGLAEFQDSGFELYVHKSCNIDDIKVFVNEFTELPRLKP